MNKSVYIIVLLLMMNGGAFAKQFKVKNCDSAAMDDVNWAVDFIDVNIDAMLAQASFIPSKYTDKIKKKWPKTTLKCSSKSDCKKDSVAGFHSSGNNIKLCWDEVRDANTTRCQLVGLIMHEKAHVAKVPIEKKHNDANAYSYVRNVDLVYRLDAVVENYCNTVVTSPPVANYAEGANPVESGATSNLTLGEHCSRDTQCASKQCSKGVCTCNDDLDCGSAGTARCKKRIGKNYCVPQGGLIGEFCKKNSDCGIGKCEKQSCVCKNDSDCTTSFGSTDFRCAKPALGKNFCQATNLAVGAACSKNSDCASDKCKKDKCD